MRTVCSIHRTLAAMFHGWLVCNAVFFAGTLAAGAIYGKTPEGALVLLFYSAVFSLFPITAAGLLVVLPVDLALAKDSPWRRPRRACLLGAAAGFTSVSLPVWVLTRGEAELWITLAGAVLAAITGLRAVHYLATHQMPET